MAETADQNSKQITKIEGVTLNPFAKPMPLGGPRDITLVAVSVIFFWAALPWLWFFARRFFDDYVAGMAVLLYYVIPISDKLSQRLVSRVRVYNVENIRSICESLPPGSLLVSDVPWAVAWYGHNSSLWLPYRIEDYEEIRIYRKSDVAGFYLTPFYLSTFYSPRERSPDWKKVYQTGWIPGGWGLNFKTVLPDNHIFLSRNIFTP